VNAKQKNIFFYISPDSVVNVRANVNIETKIQAGVQVSKCSSLALCRVKSGQQNKTKTKQKELKSPEVSKRR
jgi:hypothetical protein